jgi:Transposase
MSKPAERVEVITGRERRRRYSAEEKVRLVEEIAKPGMTVSAVARSYAGNWVTAGRSGGGLCWRLLDLDAVANSDASILSSADSPRASGLQFPSSRDGSLPKPQLQ